MRHSRQLLGTPWETALEFLPTRLRVDHSADQYGLETSFAPPEYTASHAAVRPEDPNAQVYQLTRGLTPVTDEALYSPAKEPFIVPPKHRRHYNFGSGHGKYLYSKDPLWVEARERHWDDLQMALHVHRRNYEHVRRKYRKQWQDAHRYNLDEYLTVMNRVRRQDKAEREVTERRRQREWEEDLCKIDAIAQLHAKRRNLSIERKWQNNVWLFERYSEELMNLKDNKMDDFITLGNMEEMIDVQLGRWTERERSRSKLNMFGRIPYSDTNDCIPVLDAQWEFMRSVDDIEEQPKEAFRRLSELERTKQGTMPAEHKPTTGDYEGAGEALDGVQPEAATAGDADMGDDFPQDGTVVK